MVTQWHLYREPKKNMSNLMVRLKVKKEVSRILANSGEGGIQKEKDINLLQDT